MNNRSSYGHLADLVYPCPARNVKDVGPVLATTGEPPLTPESGFLAVS